MTSLSSLSKHATIISFGPDRDITPLAHWPNPFGGRATAVNFVIIGASARVFRPASYHLFMLPSFVIFCCSHIAIPANPSELAFHVNPRPTAHFTFGAEKKNANSFGARIGPSSSARSTKVYLATSESSIFGHSQAPQTKGFDRLIWFLQPGPLIISFAV